MPDPIATSTPAVDFETPLPPPPDDEHSSDAVPVPDEPVASEPGPEPVPAPPFQPVLNYVSAFLAQADLSLAALDSVSRAGRRRAAKQGGRSGLTGTCWPGSEKTSYKFQTTPLRPSECRR